MLRPIEPQSSANIVWAEDPAVSSADDEYADKASIDPGCWKDMLTIREGQKPTRFVIGVIPPSDMVRIEDDARLGTRDFRAFTLFWSCFVTGLRDIQDSGFGTIPKVSVNGAEYVDPEWIENNFGGSLLKCAMFVGKTIWNWNQANQADVKNS